MSIRIRHTELCDLPVVMDVYAYAREQMKKSGNPHQWGDTHPAEAVIRNDIENKNSYVIEKDGVICGVFSFIIGEEPTYGKIEGEWIGDGEYGTIHRIAGSGEAHGVFDMCLGFCESMMTNIRIDTHRDNKIMQHLITKNGFEMCGIIYVDDGSPRIAYQKIEDRKTEYTTGRCDRQKQIAALATDGEHIVMWDIDSLLSVLAVAPFICVPTSKLKPEKWLSINKEYAKTTDVSKPIILFELPENKAYIADGNHRLYRAVAENIPTMNVVFVPEKTHLQYLFRCTSKDYYEVIGGLLSENIFIDRPL